MERSHHDFHGLPAHSLANAHLRVDYLTGAGPRLVRLLAAASNVNLLAETPDIVWQTPHGVSHLYGGHRLWHAPEAFPRTYLPDAPDGLSVEELPDGVRLRQLQAGPAGVLKGIEVRLATDRPALTVRHTLTNATLWPLELAPWAITQAPLGGVAVLPRLAPAPSPYLPNRSLAFWPYAGLNDPRLHLTDDLILIAGQVGAGPFKIGCFAHAGWIGYLLGDSFFVKRFSPQPGLPHPDLQSNCEVYVWDRFLELETLGPLVRLEPDATVVHTETWELHHAPGVAPTVASLRSLATQLGLPL